MYLEKPTTLGRGLRPPPPSLPLPRSERAEPPAKDRASDGGGGGGGGHWGGGPSEGRWRLQATTSTHAHIKF